MDINLIYNLLLKKMSWLSSGPKKKAQQSETVDKEIYDKTFDENTKLNTQFKKLAITFEERKPKLDEADKKIQQLQNKLNEGTVLLGILANDNARTSDKKLAKLAQSVREIIDLEQKIKILEDKNIKLLAKSGNKTASEKDIQNKINAIKEIEGDYNLSNINPTKRAQMSIKEEIYEKNKILSEQMENARKNAILIQKMAQIQKPGWEDDIEIQ